MIEISVVILIIGI
ncbi:MAG: hypothetical protein FJX30_02010 [Alphaproteobacteria bacterium]|nr:hypothetical protein [Alphaproteobacteria bacterium]